MPHDLMQAQQLHPSTTALGIFAARLGKLKWICVQDLYTFCAFALLLQFCIFMLFISKARQHAHSPETTFKGVVNMIIAAVPTGVPTGQNPALAHPLLSCAQVFLEDDARLGG